MQISLLVYHKLLSYNMTDTVNMFAEAYLSTDQNYAYLPDSFLVQPHLPAQTLHRGYLTRKWICSEIQISFTFAAFEIAIFYHISIVTILFFTSHERLASTFLQNNIQYIALQDTHTQTHTYTHQLNTHTQPTQSHKSSTQQLAHNQSQKTRKD